MVRINCELIVKREVRRGRAREFANDDSTVVLKLWPADTELVGKVV